MAVIKQLKFSVKTKPRTTDYVLHIHAYFMIKSLWKTGVCERPALRLCWKRRENREFHVFRTMSTFSAVEAILKIDYKTVNTVPTQYFNHRIGIKYATRSQFSVVPFNTKI